MDENNAPFTTQEKNNSIHRHKRKNKVREPTDIITYEKQKEIFDEETLEQIRIFREARSNWIKSKESEEEKFDLDSKSLFGDGYQRKTPWYKKLKLSKDQKSPPEPTKVEEGWKGQTADDEKILKGILKKKPIEQEDVLGVDDFRDDVKFRDDSDYEGSDSEYRPVRKKDHLKFEEDVEDFEEEIRFKDDVKYVSSKEIAGKDKVKYEKEKRKELGKKEKKPLKFTKVPGPEDQCKCEHSGEYTVLVKGVCFCEKPIRPTCIPIIPPAYLNPRVADLEEPDAEIRKTDSLELHRRIFPKSPSPRKGKDKKERKMKVKDKDKKKKKKDEEGLVEIYSDEPLKKPQTKNKTEIKSTKSVQDMKLDFSTHHRAHAKSDIHAPLHFDDLLGEEDAGKSEITLKDQQETQSTPQNPDASPFLMKRKISLPSSERSRPPTKPKEQTTTKSILEKDKKGKTEHGHVHFDNDNHYSDDDWDSNKYYTKYGQAADAYKRKNEKTVMTALITSFTEWWKGKSQE